MGGGEENIPTREQQKTPSPMLLRRGVAHLREAAKNPVPNATKIFLETPGNQVYNNMDYVML